MQRKWQIIAIGLTLAIMAACGGGSVSSSPSNPAPVSRGTGSIKQLNHIIWMLQENRSFDNYFGSLNAYRSAHGLGANDVDGLPSDASNPSFDGSSKIAAFHISTVCIENLTPSWNESRVDVNRNDAKDPSSPMNGFVYSAAHYSQDSNVGLPGSYVDVDGIRAMGYYTDADLPYYYFMATQFATSDRFFSPILSRTPPNRIAMFAASALGISNNIPTGTSYSANQIFALLQNAGISWKIYETSGNTYLGYFGGFYLKYKSTNIFPISQYFTDLKNGTLPQVAFIETGVEKSDESGTSADDEHPDSNIQIGAAFVSTLINGLMQSSSWKDSVFMLAYDEGGGLYDHVPPQPAVVPDNIAPVLESFYVSDTYSRTGFRVPMLVISPFAKSGYVSHTVMDSTAILGFIEERFNLPHLTARDAAQPPMDEFFDFTNVPNMTPPSNVPTQQRNGKCSIHSIVP